MAIRILSSAFKAQYDAVVRHPVQTWAWGDFQQTQGHHVYRLGIFDKEKLLNGFLLTFHQIPHTPFSVGACLRGPQISQPMLDMARKLGQKHKAIFVKFEPDLIKNKKLPQFPHLVASPKSAFYPHSHIVNLSQSEEDLLAAMHHKTRYNIKIAQRHGVKITEATTDAGFKTYLKLLFDTVSRQGFYLHTPKYHQTLWQTLKDSGMIKILHATYQGRVIAAFMLFVKGDRLFYPYGASLAVHRRTQAPTLLMWQAIKLGQQLGLNSFDMWGSLGPNANPNDPTYGFHRFKQGFGGDLVEFVGSWDLVLKPNLYRLYNLINQTRWWLLRLLK